MRQLPFLLLEAIEVVQVFLEERERDLLPGTHAFIRTKCKFGLWNEQGIPRWIDKEFADHGAWNVEIEPAAFGFETLKLEIERVQIEECNMLCRQVCFIGLILHLLA